MKPDAQQAPSGEIRPYLLITNDLGPHTGGIENFLLGLLKYLPRSGIAGKEIVIYTSQEENSAAFDEKLEKDLGVKIIRDKTKMLIPTPWVNKRIAKVMKTYQSTRLWYGAAAPLAFSARYLKKQGAQWAVSITHGHEVWWSALPIFRSVMKSIGKSNDVITYLGNYTQKAIRKSVGELVRMEHIAPGIDCDHFSPSHGDLELKKELGLIDKKIILVVGRLVKRKGQDLLISSMPSILKKVPQAHLLIVGIGKDEKRLHKIVEKNKVNNQVTFVGRVGYEKLPQYFHIADVFAMPARNRLGGLEVEGLGIVYLEAGACGVGVIAGNSGGAPDAVKDGETGYVVNGHSEGELVEKIVYLLENPEVAKNMGTSGQKWAKEYWSWELWAEKFSQLLKGN